MKTTTFGTVDVTDSAVRTAPIDVRANHVNHGSRQSVPILIEPAANLVPHEIDVDTLRFGELAAVVDGEIALAHRAQKLGTGPVGTVPRERNRLRGVPVAGRHTVHRRT